MMRRFILCQILILVSASFSSAASSQQNAQKEKDSKDSITTSVFADAFPKGYLADSLNMSKKCEETKERAKRNLILFFIGLVTGLGAASCFFVLCKKKKSVHGHLDDSQKVINKPDDQDRTIIPPKPIPKPISGLIQNDKGFAFDDGCCCVIGDSVIGNNHISMKLPCQDSCGYENLGEGWGIAVTSDGAGSAEHSDAGSKVVVLRAIDHFKKYLSSKGWIKEKYIPTDAEWTQASYLAIRAVRDDLEKFAQTKSVDVKSLNATIIVVIHTPFGLLTSHVGDGRAGYKNKAGEWKSVISPHKGDEANQTIFVTSDFWSIPNYVMSGVMVPESRVIRDDVTAFTLMSDGCETSSWLYNQFDEVNDRYFDPNLPFPRFFDPLIKSLIEMHTKGEHPHDTLNKWNKFLTEGGKFSTEPDDKTMIIGVLLK